VAGSTGSITVLDLRFSTDEISPFSSSLIVKEIPLALDGLPFPSFGSNAYPVVVTSSCCSTPSKIENHVNIGFFAAAWLDGRLALCRIEESTSVPSSSDCQEEREDNVHGEDDDSEGELGFFEDEHSISVEKCSSLRWRVTSSLNTPDTLTSIHSMKALPGQDFENPTYVACSWNGHGYLFFETSIVQSGHSHFQVEGYCFMSNLDTASSSGIRDFCTLTGHKVSVNYFLLRSE
jgi:hypothetical protein